MKLNSTSLIIGLIIGLLVGVSIGWFITPQAPPAATTLKTAGSTTIYPLSAAWSSAYFPVSSYTVKIEVSAGGSGYGRSSCIEGSVDFGAASSYKAPTAYGAATDDQVKTIPIAADALAIIVNPAVNTSGMRLTREHLVAIFQANITTWADLVSTFSDIHSIDATGAIHVYVRADASGTTATYTKWLEQGEYPSNNWTLGDDELINWPSIDTFHNLDGNPGVQGGVASNSAGIGYVGFSFTEGLTLVTLYNEGNDEWIVPSPEAAKLAIPDPLVDAGESLFDSTTPGAYPIARLIFYLVNTNPPLTSFLRIQYGVAIRTDTVTFLRWALDPLGGQSQEIIRNQVGYLELTGTGALTYAEAQVDALELFLLAPILIFQPMVNVLHEE